MSRPDGMPNPDTGMTVRSSFRGAFDFLQNPRPSRIVSTVVELLVIAAIIVLMIALALPALARAKEAARTVACANNVRQIGMATLAYAGRNDGYLPVPVAVPGVASEPAIRAASRPGLLDFGHGTLIPDLGGPARAEGLFKCASDPEPRRLSKYQVVPYMPRNFSYVFNTSAADGWPLMRAWKGDRVTQIRSPARKVLLYENGDSAALGAAPVVYDPLAYGGGAVHLVIGLRHHNRSNVFFADGHVELFDSTLLKDPKAAHASANAANVKYFRFDSE